MSEAFDELEKLFMDSDQSIELHQKVDDFARGVQDYVTDNLMLTFTVEELQSIELIYGERFLYRMLPDVQYVLSGPSPSGVIH